MAKMHIFSIFLTFFSLIYLSYASNPLQVDRERAGGILSQLAHSAKSKERVVGGRSGQILDDSYRLPDTLIPSHYDLKFRPILSSMGPEDPVNDGELYTAPGEATIHFTCASETNLVILHGNFMTARGIINSTVHHVNSEGEEIEEIPIVDTFYSDDDKHFHTFTLDRTLTVNEKYTIFIHFIAPIFHYENRMDGLYLSQYIDPVSGSRRDLCATQLQHTSARQMFPSFDEPHLKATFAVTIGRKPSYKSWANMGFGTSSEPDENGWIWDSYLPTEIMSTYLLAIMVSDFDCVEAEGEEFTGIARACGPPHLIAAGQGDYPANISARMLKYFEEEFGIPYTFPKMDSVGLPHFAAGAMENWGLNFYRIEYLLYEQGVSLENSRFIITYILAHELAHQWFGNLITAAWWSDLWVNEGFATYLSYVATEKTVPEFEAIKAARLTDALQYVMKSDAMRSSRSIVNSEAYTPDEVDDMFDAITYEKGSAIIKMMEGFLTRETFFAGLRTFLAEKSHGSAFQDDLFDPLERHAQQDNRLPEDLTVNSIMHTWTLQKGFPLIRVTRAGANSIYISQEKFHFDTRERRNLNPNELWTVPISMATQSNPNFEDHTAKHWLRKNVSLDAFEHNTEEWIMLNPDATAYYRVLYDQHFTNKLIDLLVNIPPADPNLVSPSSRSQLIDDYFQSAYNSYVQIETALELSFLLRHEDEFVVWDTAFTNLRKVLEMLSSSSSYIYFRTNYMPLIEDAWTRLDASGNVIGDKLILKSLLIDWACAFEGLKCEEYSNQLLQEWRETPEQNPIPVDFQNSIYCSIMSFGNVETYDFLFEQYKTTGSQVQKNRLISGLACTKEFFLIEKMLEDSLDPENGFSQDDTSYVLQRVARNSIARDRVFSFVAEENYQRIIEHGGIRTISSVMSSLATFWNNDFELNKMQDFVDTKENEVPDNILNLLRGSVNTINGNINWMVKFHDHISDFLRAKANN